MMECKFLESHKDVSGDRRGWCVQWVFILVRGRCSDENKIDGTPENAKKARRL